MSRLEASISETSSGWQAGGRAIAHQADGVVITTPIRIRTFPTQQQATAWLEDFAKALRISDISILVERRPRAKATRGLRQAGR